MEKEEIKRLLTDNPDVAAVRIAAIMSERELNMLKNGAPVGVIIADHYAIVDDIIKGEYTDDEIKFISMDASINRDDFNNLLIDVVLTVYLKNGSERVMGEYYGFDDERFVVTYK